MATVTQVAVWGFTIVVAINQLGIATTLINTLLIGLVGGLALAFGLAFGLGGRDRAAQILDRVGRNMERAGPRLERAANSARRQAEEWLQEAQGVIPGPGAGGCPSADGHGEWLGRAVAERPAAE